MLYSGKQQDGYHRHFARRKFGGGGKRKKEKREDRLAKVTKNLVLSVAVMQNKVCHLKDDTYEKAM